MAIFGPRWQEGRIEAIERRLEALETSVRDLKKGRRELLTEWESTFEKFNALWARLSRRLPRTARVDPDKADGPQQQSAQVNPLAVELMRGR